jgi:hypothetical protein
MRQALSILSRCSEAEQGDHRDQSRQEALRVQRTIQRMLDEASVAADAARAAKEAERQAKEAVLQEKNAALTEVARLKALLNQAGDS